MKAKDIANHPAYPTTTWRLVPTQEGMLDVAETRGGPIKLSWEVHGEGKEKLVVCLNFVSSHCHTHLRSPPNE